MGVPAGLASCGVRPTRSTHHLIVYAQITARGAILPKKPAWAAEVRV